MPKISWTGVEKLGYSRAAVPKCRMTDIKDYGGMGLSVSCDRIENIWVPVNIRVTSDEGSMTCSQVEDVVNLKFGQKTLGHSLNI
jgi:hypothetical protein